MKRVISAFIISALITVLAIVGNITVDKVAEKYTEHLEIIEYCAKSENQSMASIEIESLISDFKEQRHLLELFIKREYVSNLCISMEGLRAYSNSETWRDLESEAAKAREQLSSIHHLFFSII